MPLSRREFVASSAALAAAAGLPRTAWTAAAGQPDVIVIGAGLSGLETALTLEENGASVLMLEGRENHIGGRVYTLFDVPGHPEAGGNTVSNAYGRMLAAGEKYGIEVVNLAPRIFSQGGQALYVGGEHISLEDWATHPKNPFPPAMKKLPPWAWGDAMFKQHMPFKDLQQWADPSNFEFDISVHDFLASHGATDEMIRLGYDTNIAYGTTSNDVSLLMQAFADYWQAVNRGTLAAFSRTGATLAPGQDKDPAAQSRQLPLIGAYKGGNQRLPLAMADRVKGDILTGKRVVAIDAGPRSATVRCADGSRYTAKAVVCSMPFTTLRHVAINPLPPTVQLRAIQTLGTIPITQFHLVPKKPFWEDDGLPASMWTDGRPGVVLAFPGGDNGEITSLTAWARGLNASYADLIGPENAAKQVIAEIERMRPAAKGQLELAALHSWGLDPFAAGDWSIYEPGQVREFSATLSKPHQRLYFCGEHTSKASRGMEGALESAERVVLEVLGELG